MKADQTQSELAERVADFQGWGGTYDRKIGKATISQWELGTHQPRIDDLPALAAALGVKIPELLPKAHLRRLGTPPSVAVGKSGRRTRSSKRSRSGLAE
jgi:transcriptional regulator with XRE-family HTH domain